MMDVGSKIIVISDQNIRSRLNLNLKGIPSNRVRVSEECLKTTSNFAIQGVHYLLCFYEDIKI